ncbi:MAG: DUF4382 domain-containing protein [Acidobacteriota bacterium]
MKKTILWVCFILVASVLIVQNCESPFSSKSPAEQGFFRLLLTDAPLDLDDLEAVYVTVSEIAVKKASSDNYIVVLDEETEFELLELKGNPQPIVETYLEVGHYTGIRFVVEAARIIVDGNEEGLTIPSMEIIVNVEFDVTEDGTVELTLDFDAENSIQVVEAGQSGLYILRPVILVDDITYE